MPNASAQFLSIAGLTIKDLLRQPVCLLVNLTAIVLIVFLPQALAHQLGQQESLARDSSLAFQLLFGVILTAYASASTFHSECAAGTLLTLFSRPVNRATFFLAKLCGVSLLILIFVWISTTAALLAGCLAPQSLENHSFALRTVALSLPIALLLAALLNYHNGYSFPASSQILLTIGLTLAALYAGSRSPAGDPLPFAARLDWRIIPAGCMGGMALMILSCLALTLATRLAPAPAIACLSIIFIAGLLSDYLCVLSSPWPVVRVFIQSALPDIQSFWLADQLAAKEAVGMRHVTHGMLYTLAYCSAIASLGILLLRKRDF